MPLILFVIKDQCDEIEQNDQRTIEGKDENVNSLPGNVRIGLGQHIDEFIKSGFAILITQGYNIAQQPVCSGDSGRHMTKP